MNHFWCLAVGASIILIDAVSNAYAGAPPIPVPESSTLAVLGAGIGAVAILKFWTAK
jgi:hypothetical protein